MLFSLLISTASASFPFPDAVKDAAGMPCAPTCMLCHETMGGGTGTVTQPFGIAMMERGLQGSAQTELVPSAYAALDADNVDSDGDGVPDADELSAGENPNPDGEPFCGEDGASALPTPSYGCFNSSAAPASVVGALGGLLAIGAIRRRR